MKLWTFSLTLALSVITVSASAQELAKPESIKPVAVFSELPDWACAAQFSPVEPLLAIGTYEQVRFYSPTTKKEVGRLPSKTGFIRSLLFSPDGKWLYTGGYQAVEIWDVAGRKRVFARKLHKGYVNDLALSADGMTLLSGGEDRLAKLWRVTPSTSAEGGIELSAEPFLAIPEQPYPVLGVAISPRNDLFATASGEETQAAKPGEVKLWSLSDAAAQHTFPFHEKAATKVAFGAEGTRLASASTDEKVDVYDVDARKALGFFPGHSRPINAVVWWSVRTGTTPTPEITAEMIRQLSGQLLISGSGGRTKGMNDVRIWNRDDGTEFGLIDHHAAKVTAVAVSADGVWLATTSYDKSAAIWDLRPILKKAAATLTAAAPEK